MPRKQSQSTAPRTPARRQKSLDGFSASILRKKIAEAGFSTKDQEKIKVAMRITEPETRTPAARGRILGRSKSFRSPQSSPRACVHKNATFASPRRTNSDQQATNARKRATRRSSSGDFTPLSRSTSIRNFTKSVSQAMKPPFKSPRRKIVDADEDIVVSPLESSSNNDSPSGRPALRSSFGKSLSLRSLSFTSPKRSGSVLTTDTLASEEMIILEEETRFSRTDAKRTMRREITQAEAAVEACKDRLQRLGEIAMARYENGGEVSRATLVSIRTFKRSQMEYEILQKRVKDLVNLSAQVRMDSFPLHDYKDSISMIKKQTQAEMEATDAELIKELKSGQVQKFVDELQ